MLWVFGYGSLMWRPDFAYDERRGALVRGYHRAACILSTRYRGTPEVPGLVAGLDRGGACRGVAFAVAAERADDVIAYLMEREMVTDVYCPRYLPAALDDGRMVRSLAFVANRKHPHYVGGLPLIEAARLVRQGRGVAGSAHDYFTNIVSHLTEFGIRDGHLHRLLAAVAAAGEVAVDSATRG